MRKKRQAESRQKPGKEVKPTITISVDAYSCLLTELADMKARANYMLEYKNVNEKLLKQLDQNIGQTDELKSHTEELKKSVAELQSELDRMKSRGLMGRIFNK